MARIEHQVVIRRPVAEVFAYLDSSDRLPTWQSGVVAAHRDGPPSAGTRETHVRSVLGRRIENQMRITAYEPNQRYDVRGRAGPVPYTFTSTVEPVVEGTRITIVLDLQPRGVARLASLVLGRVMACQLRSDFARLKQLLEAGHREG
jgi:uncharacterized protein YndB with AHSA1/START domain